MPDYGHPLEFGFFLDPSSGDPAGTLATARLIEDLGYDLIGIQDHPYQARHFDTLSLIGVILGQTERVRVFPDVANLPLRPPAVLAKAAATLDQLSGGRFELGLGAGAFWEPIRAMGGPDRSPKEALGALAEGIEVIRAFWSGQRSVRFRGTYYQVEGLRPGPAPGHDIRLWLGVLGPRALALAGRVADGWIASMSYVPPEVAVRSNEIVDAAAREAGRDPAAVRRIYNLGGSFTATAPQPASDADREIVGPADHWVEVLTHLAVDLGISSFVLWGEPDPARLRTFVEVVAPAVRERVAAHRASDG
jgi:alkanesulfonate monooxygenase SsuD/methylene tetrahydromethanopterin reductase-like flavin-dependent oxidoreductase (luciferase family)